jgi:hypothetical protein
MIHPQHAVKGLTLFLINLASFRQRDDLITIIY